MPFDAVSKNINMAGKCSSLTVKERNQNHSLRHADVAKRVSTILIGSMA